MKLYTEEQVRQIFENLSVSSGYDYNMETYCDSITPIQLPSDEEIKKEVKLIEPYATNDYCDGFSDGINWYKEQILNQNK